MMKTDTEVCQQTVYLLHAIVVHKVAQVAEVAMHKLPPRVLCQCVRLGIAVGIYVLVKREQTSRLPQLSHNRPRVSAATESNVHIGPRRVDM